MALSNRRMMVSRKPVHDSASARSCELSASCVPVQDMLSQGTLSSSVTCGTDGSVRCPLQSAINRMGIFILDIYVAMEDTGVIIDLHFYSINLLAYKCYQQRQLTVNSVSVAVLFHQLSISDECGSTRRSCIKNVSLLEIFLQLYNKHTRQINAITNKV